MPKEQTTIATVSFHADELCLNFVNTVDYWGREERRDYLTCYDDLITWSRRIGLIDRSRADRLTDAARQAPDEAARAHALAVALRDCLYRLFRAVIEGRPPAEADLELFNRYVGPALNRQRLEAIEGRFQLVPVSGGDQLHSLLDPVVASAVEVLTSDQLDRIKSCSNPECGWLFLDSSRNRSRRWCDMADCGNRAKANRFYKRKKNSLNTES